MFLLLKVIYTKLNYGFPYIRSLSLRRDRYVELLYSDSSSDFECYSFVLVLSVGSSHLPTVVAMCYCN